MTSPRWTWHGGGIDAARHHFGGEDWLDLSTGINPHAWPHANAVPVDWRALPGEDDVAALERAAAAHFGCDAGSVCAVPGTEVGLRLAGEMLIGPAYHVTPTYRTHTEMVADSRPIAFDALDRADGATLILANPNNPDGRLLSRERIGDLLARRGANGWLVLDEAFADCHPNHTVADRVSDEQRLIVFRSFGKFFGLAGVRLGFVIGSRQIMDDLRRRLGAWPVSAAAIAIGTAAYGDHAWTAMMRRKLEAEAARLDAALHRRGYRVIGACPLFRLIECADGAALFDHLARRAILTRPFAHQPQWLRVGLPGSEEGLARFISALPDHG